MISRAVILCGFLFSASPSLATFPLGKVPPEIKLEGNSGLNVKTGGPWSSKDTLGKVTVLFYVTSSTKDKNSKTEEVLRAEKFPEEGFASVAVVNMASSPAPNFLIGMTLKSKQKSNPRTTFVKDFQKALVNQWGLADNDNDILVLDKSGKVVFSVDGLLSDQQTEDLLAVIKKELGKQDVNQKELAKDSANKIESKQADAHTEGQNAKDQKPK